MRTHFSEPKTEEDVYPATVQSPPGFAVVDKRYVALGNLEFMAGKSRCNRAQRP